MIYCCLDIIWPQPLPNNGHIYAHTCTTYTQHTRTHTHTHTHTQQIHTTDTHVEALILAIIWTIFGDPDAHIYVSVEYHWTWSYVRWSTGIISECGRLGYEFDPRLRQEFFSDFSFLFFFLSLFKFLRKAWNLSGSLRCFRTRDFPQMQDGKNVFFQVIFGWFLPLLLHTADRACNENQKKTTVAVEAFTRSSFRWPFFSLFFFFLFSHFWPSHTQKTAKSTVEIPHSNFRNPKSVVIFYTHSSVLYLRVPKVGLKFTFPNSLNPEIEVIFTPIPTSVRTPLFPLMLLSFPFQVSRQFSSFVSGREALDSGITTTVISLAFGLLTSEPKKELHMRSLPPLPVCDMYIGCRIEKSENHRKIHPFPLCYSMNFGGSPEFPWYARRFVPLRCPASHLNGVVPRNHSLAFSPSLSITATDTCKRWSRNGIDYSFYRKSWKTSSHSSERIDFARHYGSWFSWVVCMRQNILDFSAQLFTQFLQPKDIQKWVRRKED